MTTGQFGMAIAVLVITATRLYQENSFGIGVCWLGTNPFDYQYCRYSYGLGAISLGFTVVLAMVQCLDCEFGGVTNIIDTIFAGLGLAWWIVGAVLIKERVDEADSLNFPQEGERNAVFILAVTTAVAFGVCFIISSFGFLTSLWNSIRGHRVEVVPQRAPAEEIPQERPVEAPKEDLEKAEPVKADEPVRPIESDDELGTAERPEA